MTILSPQWSMPLPTNDADSIANLKAIMLLNKQINFELVKGIKCHKKSFDLSYSDKYCQHDWAPSNMVEMVGNITKTFAKKDWGTRKL